MYNQLYSESLEAASHPSGADGDSILSMETLLGHKNSTFFPAKLMYS